MKHLCIFRLVSKCQIILGMITFWNCAYADFNHSQVNVGPSPQVQHQFSYAKNRSIESEKLSNNNSEVMLAREYRNYPTWSRPRWSGPVRIKFTYYNPYEFQSQRKTHSKNKPKLPQNSTNGKKAKTKNQESDIKKPKCACGMANLGSDHSVLFDNRRGPSSITRIAGGTVSKENAWPWMAAIAYVKKSGRPYWFCGGSIINNKYVLSAAHCVKSMEKKGLDRIRIYLGTNEIIEGDKKDKLIMNVSQVIPHPRYSKTLQDYDVGLIRLSEEIHFTEKVKPLCLSQKGAPFLGRTALVAGWGSTALGIKPPQDLREVKVKIVSNFDCYQQYFYNYRMPISPNMICAWLPGKDSCQGDSGGPLFIEYPKNRYSQIGIVSFGPPRCGETSIPGVYSRLTSSISWIKSKTKDADYCPNSFGQSIVRSGYIFKNRFKLKDASN